MPSKTPSITLGAVAYVVLSVGISFLVFKVGGTLLIAGTCLLCLVILAGPMLAVWHYASTHQKTLLPGQGAGLGAITGAIGALVGGLADKGLSATGLLPNTAERIVLQREAMINFGMDPGQVDEQFAGTSGGLLSNPVVEVVFAIAIAAALGALFGVLASVMFKKGGPATDAAV